MLALTAQKLLPCHPSGRGLQDLLFLQASLADRESRQTQVAQGDRQRPEIKGQTVNRQKEMECILQNPGELDRVELPFLLQGQGDQLHLWVPRAPRRREVLVRPGLRNHPGIGIRNTPVSQPQAKDKTQTP